MSLLKSGSTSKLLRGTLLSIKSNGIGINNSALTNKISSQYISHKMFSSRAAKIATSAFVISGSYYGITSYQKAIQPARNMSGIHMKPQTMQLSKLPEFKPTSVVAGPTKLDFDITLFQYCSCPFCCKTRTLLDYFGINYNIVEVNPVMRSQLKWSKDYKKVPILLAHSRDSGESQIVYQINDSSVIASSIGSFLMSRRKIASSKVVKDGGLGTIEDLGKILINYQAIDVEKEDKTVKKEIPNKYFLMLGDIDEFELEKRESSLAEERYWRDWTDNVLVHSLSPNIYRTLPESKQAFDSFSVRGQWDKHFSTFERLTAVYAGSSVMWLVGKKLKKKYNLKGDVRESLYDNCRQWMKAIGKNRKFMGGNKPNLADLSVYGVLTSIEGCEAFEDVLRNTNIKPWYTSMKECCDQHTGRELFNAI